LAPDPLAARRRLNADFAAFRDHQVGGVRVEGLMVFIPPGWTTDWPKTVVALALRTSARGRISKAAPFRGGPRDVPNHGPPTPVAEIFLLSTPAGGMVISVGEP